MKTHGRLSARCLSAQCRVLEPAAFIEGAGSFVGPRDCPLLTPEPSRSGSPRLAAQEMHVIQELVDGRPFLLFQAEKAGVKTGVLRPVGGFRDLGPQVEVVGLAKERDAEAETNLRACVKSGGRGFGVEGEPLLVQGSDAAHQGRTLGVHGVDHDLSFAPEIHALAHAEMFQRRGIVLEEGENLFQAELGHDPGHGGAGGGDHQLSARFLQPFSRLEQGSQGRAVDETDASHVQHHPAGTAAGQVLDHFHEGGANEGPEKNDVFRTIGKRVSETPFVDSHEHLLDERFRLRPASTPVLKCDDWSLLLSHYLDSDLIACGMPLEEYTRFFSREVDPIEKWRILEPYWPAVRNTGYGKAVRIAINRLYGVDTLSRKTVARVQEGYEAWRKAGFYRKILTEIARLDSCQVNCVYRPFEEAKLSDLLLQDLGFLRAHMMNDLKGFLEPTGVTVKELDDWHRAIDWWFEKYGEYAVSIKSQAAYFRGLDYEEVPAEEAAPLFKRKFGGEKPAPADEKKIQDHLFWYCVKKATALGLPVKLHTGYYAGQNYMPIERLAGNPAEIARLARRSRKTVFVAMHIGYPFEDEMIALAKHYTNIYIDMCWAWIIDPVSSVSFLKKYLMTAPSNKLLTFGGDYIPVEPVVGHAEMARWGLTRALTELVLEGWLKTSEALGLIEPLMRGNAYRVFDLEKKKRINARCPWR